MNKPYSDEKIPVNVQIKTMSGETVGGCLFLGKSQRITDLLNDERKFIPLEDGNGYIQVIAKNNIEKVFIKDKRESEIE